MSVTEKHEKLKEAEEAYKLAKIGANAARSEETAAINQLNEAQKAFDEAVEKVKKNSPAGDWTRRSGAAATVKANI